MENRFKNLKDYYKQIKRQNKLKSGDGVTATEEGKATFMSEMRILSRGLASSLNCPTPSPSAATPAASHIALSSMRI